MKFVIALLVAAVSADAPPYFNEPPFAVSTHPAAAGLIQLNSNQRFLDIEMSEEPKENNYFADGEKGDADMGLKIQMKGDHFDTYKQNLVQIPDFHNQRLLQIEMSEEPVAVAEGEDTKAAPKAAKVEVLAPEKVHTLDPKIAKSHTTFYNRQ